MTRAAGKFSFPYACRLRGPHAYAAVLAFKCRVSGKIFHVYARPNGADVARFGIVVDKRVMPLAVARNYCKRLAREVFRAERDALAGVDLVVRPRSAVTRAQSAAARVEIRALLHNARRQSGSRSEATRPG